MTTAPAMIAAPDHSSSPTSASHPLVHPGPLDGDDPVEHVKYVLGNAPRRTWPYPHFACEDVFPQDFYREMIRRFPDDAHLRPLNNIYPKRLSLRAGVPDELDAIQDEDDRAFWRALGRSLGSRDFMRFVLRRYDPVLEDRFGAVVEPHIYLHSDVDSYGIGPHVDFHRKVVSLIFYLPEEPCDVNPVSVLVKTDPDLEVLPAQEESWEGFRSAYTLAFKPNILFTFAVTHESWHGVRPNPAGVLRRSMQYFIMLPE